MSGGCSAGGLDIASWNPYYVFRCENNYEFTVLPSLEIEKICVVWWHLRHVDDIKNMSPAA